MIPSSSLAQTIIALQTVHPEAQNLRSYSIHMSLLSFSKIMEPG